MARASGGTKGALARRFSAALAAAAVLTGAATAADTPLTLTPRGFPIVEIAINGKGPFAMVLDTGAGLTTVTTALKDELGLMKVGRMPQPVQLAGGAEPVDIYTLGFVTLAGQPAPAPITVVLDAPMKYIREARGILGMNVLSRFAVEIDQPGKRLVLRDPGAVPESGSDWTLRPLVPRYDNFLVVEADIGGVAAKAVLDTGANQTILNAKLAEALGIVAGAPGVTEGKIALSGGTTSLKAKLPSIALGETQWRDLDIQAADLPLFKALGLGDEPVLILGNDALKQVRLFVDYAGDRVYLTRPPTTPVVSDQR
ncbi:hypothetical protein sos41_11290 [Alphaproteobacteria bacterium SO-S41]|nr:hypothetical protein sos41_11290 [Alphaproteobacteria bacterium SO-S41]